MLTFTLASVVLLDEAEPETLTAPVAVEPDDGEAIETVGFEGFPLLVPGAATAPAAKIKRKNRVSAAVGGWRNRRGAKRLRGESMRRSL
jgi:hypothetical protein